MYGHVELRQHGCMGLSTLRNEMVSHVVGECMTILSDGWTHWMRSGRGNVTTAWNVTIEGWPLGETVLDGSGKGRDSRWKWKDSAWKWRWTYHWSE